ncbi:unnamed protein product [Adineta steineri]|uniref:F-box domain-containing protein n=2 Tax=Adineta steineri TaxID=433720 RepID=A0A819X0R9_9BILA|nr:unnamed protein product [Adineta steineri]
MSNLTRRNKSKLELLPDEIFLELFSYMKPIDLYHGFLNLNSRLNNILNDTYIYIHIINDNEHKNDQLCINYFARQIIYLAIDCHWTCLSYPINLRFLTNLRSLHIPMPSDEQCLDITPTNLPYLTNLTINDNVFKSILFNTNSFPHLSTCCIPRIYSSMLNTMKSNQLCITLHSLQLSSCLIHDLYDILPYLPNLNYLEIVLQSNNRNIQQDYIKHNKISHLKIKLRKLEPDFEILLKSMSNLRRIEFLWNNSYQWYNERKNFNFNRFSDIINENSKLLQRLDIDIHVSKCDYVIDTIHHINLQWFSSLSIIEIYNDRSFFITTKKISLNPEDKLITTILQSTYMAQRNAGFNRITID